MEGDRRRSGGGGGASARADLYEHDPAMGPARAQDSCSNIIIPNVPSLCKSTGKMHALDPQKESTAQWNQIEHTCFVLINTSGDGAWFSTLDMQHEK